MDFCSQGKDEQRMDKEDNMKIKCESDHCGRDASCICWGQWLCKECYATLYWRKNK